MLYISTDITKFSDFLKSFTDMFKDKHMIDLSKLSCDSLADECDLIVKHHTDCVVFLGYIEPGWMINSPSQTRIRKLFRKFPVGMVMHFTESLPFSWKNEIEIIYTVKDLNKHGESNSVNNDSSL